MVAKTLKEFYLEHRNGHNPITGEPNLYKDITDEMIWNAATKAAEEKFKAPNKANPPLSEICKQPLKEIRDMSAKFICNGHAIKIINCNLDAIKYAIES